MVHTRRIFYVADEYWIIWDSLVGERPHHFDLRFHLAPEAWERVNIVGNTVCAPEFALVFSRGSRLQIEPGWFAPLYGVKQNAPVVSAIIEGKNSAEFVTVVMPSHSHQVPELKVLPGKNAVSQTFAVEVSGAGQDGAFTDYRRVESIHYRSRHCFVPVPRLCCLVALGRRKRGPTLCRL